MSTIDDPQALSEVARRGDEIYEHDLKVRLEATDMERLVAIDVTNRKFALGDSVLKASDAPQKETGADPENIWIVRIGSVAVYHLSRSTV
ncbi:MAG: hypothetical protein IAF94_02650 [Pirellulaceae bacterium]|nr:hypothetical protein [Pirellulaceae bacterium]